METAEGSKGKGDWTSQEVIAISWTGIEWSHVPSSLNMGEGEDNRRLT
jgi:hypothetical protein